MPEKPSKNNEPQIRISKIKKGISRTINTAKYESIVIHDEIEEIIEWTTLQERQEKIDNWNTILVEGYKKTFDEVMQELGLQKKTAHFNTLQDKDTRPDPEDLKNILDDLDSIAN